MEGLTTSVKATVNLTGRQWEIFSPENMADGGPDSMSLEEATIHYNDCVARLNDAASEALSCGDPDKAREIFDRAQRAWAYFGAEDSEPTWKFVRLMREVYGSDCGY